MSDTKIDERIVCALIRLESKVAIQGVVLSALIDALNVHVGDGFDFDEFAENLMDRIPKGYTARGAAIHDGKRDALRDLSEMMRKRRATSVPDRR